MEAPPRVENTQSPSIAIGFVKRRTKKSRRRASSSTQPFAIGKLVGVNDDGVDADPPQLVDEAVADRRPRELDELRAAPAA